MYELLSSLYALTRPKQDVYYVLGCRTVWAYLPHWILRRRLVINTDGLDWKRRKWGRFARAYLKFNYWLARKTTDRLVSDSKELQKFYMEEYGTHSAFLTNGGHLLRVEDEGATSARSSSTYGVEHGGYYLVACRMEPENNIDIIVREFERSDVKEPLLIAGGANYKSAYLEQLQQTQDRVSASWDRCTSRATWRPCTWGAKGYLHGHEVGGTNPSLLKAMGCGNLVLAHDVRFNREVLGGTGLLWSKEEGSMLAQLERADEDGDAFGAKRPSPAGSASASTTHGTRSAVDHERYFRYVLGEVPDYEDSF